VGPRTGLDRCGKFGKLYLVEPESSTVAKGARQNTLDI